MDKLKYKDITEKIIGAAFEVHKFLGNACLAGKAGIPGLPAERQYGLQAGSYISKSLILGDVTG